MSRVSSDPGAYFNFGQMQITSTDDNSSLVLDADTGDVETSLVEVGFGGQAGVDTIYPWSTWADVFCLGPTSTGYLPPPCVE